MLRNLTLDDYSPFIQYDSSWVDANITTDDRMNYQNSTFRHTNVYDAKASLITDSSSCCSAELFLIGFLKQATITFRGSGLYIYGAKRTDHGLYQIAVNNEPPMAGNGYSGGSNIYQTLLFGRSNLRNQPNTVALQNIPDSGRSWLDIDYVVITYETDTDTSKSVDIDSGKFTYSSEWDTEIMSGYRTSVPYVTRTAGATATLDFQGSEITLYGRTGPNFGMFRVQVDNQEALTLNATRENSYPPTVLYTTNGLSAGKHTITLTNLEANKALAVDYATCIPHTGPPSSPKVLSPGAIGGIVAGTMIVLGMFVLGWRLLRRRKHRYQGVSSLPRSENVPVNYQWDHYDPHISLSSSQIQPPLGYVHLQPMPSTNVHRNFASRKPGTGEGPPRPPASTVLGSETQSSYDSQSDTLVTREANDGHFVRETDVRSLPPMYNQVFAIRPVTKNG
ncbi:hypothetical protein RHS03_09884, partial [Rhizoctonia solani]